MLVWDDGDGYGASPMLSYFEGELRRSCEELFNRDPLSQAVITAWRATAGRVARLVPELYSQWHQFNAGASLALRRITEMVATSAELLRKRPRPQRTAKAFFYSRKVNGRNTP